MELVAINIGYIVSVEEGNLMVILGCWSYGNGCYYYLLYSVCGGGKSDGKYWDAGLRELVAFNIGYILNVEEGNLMVNIGMLF